MKKDVIKKIKNKSFNRTEILEAFNMQKNVVEDHQLNYIVDTLIKDGEIVRIGRNKYSRIEDVNKTKYHTHYTNEASFVISYMQDHYPLLNYCIWELNWLNEFIYHLIGKNIIFIEVEKQACEFVYNDLKENVNNDILLKPSEKEMMYYSNNNTFVVIPLITESPLINKHDSTIEKIIVDLFSNKLIFLSKADYEEVMNNINNKYLIDEAKLYRYARRRGKEEEIKNYFLSITK